MLNKLQDIFWFKYEREKPLSDEPKIDKISKESNANITLKPITTTILGNNP